MLPEDPEDLVEQRDELIQRPTAIKQPRNRPKQVSEQVARARFGVDVQDDLVEMDRQIEHLTRGGADVRFPSNMS